MSIAPLGVPVAATSDGDPSFEAVGVGNGYSYDPAGSAWTFTGNAGLTGNNNAFTAGDPVAPSGTQVAFLQRGDGTISQSVPFASAGAYQITFGAIQRSGNQEDFQVLVDGTVVGTFKPSGSSYQLLATASFSVAAGSHTITFRGVDSAGGDNTAFLDSVSIAPLGAPAPAGASAVRWTVYDGQTPLLDFDGSGHQTARYLSVPGAIDELLARQTSSGVAWYLDDREGTVGDLVNNAGTVIDHVDYTAYGTVAAESAPANGDRFRYAGMEYDAAISLYYDRDRYYDPAAGRFVSQDPSGFSGSYGNLYMYSDNDTPNAIDLSGEDVRLENTPGQGGLHLRVTVDLRGGGTFSISYGVNDEKARCGTASAYYTYGIVYRDSNPPASTINSIDTTPAQDRAILAYLKSLLDQEGTYSLVGSTCREFSIRLFNLIYNKLNNGNFGPPVPPSQPPGGRFPGKGTIPFDHRWNGELPTPPGPRY